MTKFFLSLSLLIIISCNNQKDEASANRLENTYTVKGKIDARLTLDFRIDNFKT